MRAGPRQYPGGNGQPAPRAGGRRLQGEPTGRSARAGVLGFAVRLDHPAVYDHAGYLDRERSGVQVEQLPARARQLAPAHARGGFTPRCPEPHQLPTIAGSSNP